jgi:hypothetical protein
MRAGWVIAMLLLIGGGCARSDQTVELKPAFSNDTVVGQLRPTWSPSGAERNADGVRQQRIMLRVDAVNQLADSLYLRLSKIRLVGPDGPISADETRTECALPPGTTDSVLQTSVWVPVASLDAIRGVEVDYFAVPLSQRGRAFYREFLLHQRPTDGAAIDAEIATYTAAPVCAPQPH